MEKEKAMGVLGRKKEIAAKKNASADKGKKDIKDKKDKKDNKDMKAKRNAGIHKGPAVLSLLLLFCLICLSAGCTAVDSSSFIIDMENPLSKEGGVSGADAVLKDTSENASNEVDVDCSEIDSHMYYFQNEEGGGEYAWEYFLVMTNNADEEVRIECTFTVSDNPIVSEGSDSDDNDEYDADSVLDDEDGSDGSSSGDNEDSDSDYGKSWTDYISALSPGQTYVMHGICGNKRLWFDFRCLAPETDASRYSDVSFESDQEGGVYTITASNDSDSYVDHVGLYFLCCKLNGQEDEQGDLQYKWQLLDFSYEMKDKLAAGGVCTFKYTPDLPEAYAGSNFEYVTELPEISQVTDYGTCYILPCCIAYDGDQGDSKHGSSR